ncbi:MULTISPECIES: sensor histidine kinase [unclassified Paenibacillus]|uniref:sensor histidine kinase n=1 Tax=unclassified Paenibacillus TaxID=185978 RepID=UPI001AE4E600|nr:MULTISPECIES: sensor histidine kinase [unclassified Paenibacillus]MBP1157301.1 sensor histidine kinase YesM [Paenibacillus sp. PvP091]MBP1171960.1 sensor histidine kinase YesM [Paenibacillus sp. PvR098]MBP2438341.1 sensor histidine kinase YesM [Paenibacillus sp. PvP052]
MSFFQSLKRILNHLSLKLKLFILLLLISIIPVSLVNFSSEFFMLRSSTNYSASISTQYAQFVSREMSSYLQSLDQSFDNLFTNTQFQKYLNTPADRLAEQARYIIQFRPIIKNSLQFHPEVLGVLYLDRMGKVYFDSYQKRLDPAFSFNADPFYKSVFTMNTPQLVPPRPLNYILHAKDRAFSYIRPIINVNTGETMSWIIIEIREAKLKNMLSTNKNESDGQLTLYHEASGVTVSNEPLDHELLLDLRNTLHSGTPERKQFLFTSGGTEYEASYVDLLNSEWKLLWTAPLSRIKEGVRQTYYLTLFIAAISLGIALIIAFPVMKRILRPLYSLQQGMHNLGRGRYVPIPITNRGDEVGYLIHSYNQMLIKLQDMEREVYQAKIKEKERELLQLQAQINPHFLFNTLETIESYAVRNNGEAVGEMVQSVSRMMRYTVQNDNGWASLKEEIEYIRNFMTIHYYRNGKNVNALFEIDPDALGIPVMKLSIQPYIENAIKYGWSPYMSNEQFILKVKVEVLHEEYVQVKVHDTGTGISGDVLQKLQQLIHSKGETTDPFFRKHTGIYNAYRRFIIVYGDRAYFHIDSSPEHGTVIEFRMPLQIQKPQH